MVKIMENPMNKWMIWGVNTTIFGNTREFFVKGFRLAKQQDLNNADLDKLLSETAKQEMDEHLEDSTKRNPRGHLRVNLLGFEE